MRPSSFAALLVALLAPAGLAAQDPAPADSTPVAAEPDDPGVTNEVISEEAVEIAPLESPEILPSLDHRLLATSRTSTMETELNAAAAEGYRLAGVIGGETAFGGAEVVAVMSRPTGEAGETAAPRWEYRLLATNRTSTMQQELQVAGEAGYEFRGQTVFETRFGGREVVVILERDRDAPVEPWEYRLFATQRTSTMEAELRQAGAEGFELLGLTVAETMLGGKEIVAITRRARVEGETASR